MRLVPLSDLDGYSDKEQLPLVRGRITAVYKVHKGNRKDGNPYHLQEIQIEGDGKKVLVFLDNKEEIQQSWKGRDIELSCHEGDKGLSGVYAFDDDYKDPIVRKIKVTKTGNISLITNGGRQEAPPRDREPEREPAPPRDEPRHQSAPPQDRAPHSDRGSASDIADVKRQITQCANLMLLCQICIEKIVVPGFKSETGKDMDEARKGALATSLYISVERKGANTLMPTHPLIAPPKSQSQTPPRDEPPQDQKW